MTVVFGGVNFTHNNTMAVMMVDGLNVMYQSGMFMNIGVIDNSGMIIITMVENIIVMKNIGVVDTGMVQNIGMMNAGMTENIGMVDTSMKNITVMDDIIMMDISVMKDVSVVNKISLMSNISLVQLGMMQIGSMMMLVDVMVLMHHMMINNGIGVVQEVMGFVMYNIGDMMDGFNLMNGFVLDDLVGRGILDIRSSNTMMTSIVGHNIYSGVMIGMVVNGMVFNSMMINSGMMVKAVMINHGMIIQSVMVYNSMMCFHWKVI